VVELGHRRQLHLALRFVPAALAVPKEKNTLPSFGEGRETSAAVANRFVRTLRSIVQVDERPEQFIRGFVFIGRVTVKWRSTRVGS
jgi:hypothetical protein